MVAEEEGKLIRNHQSLNQNGVKMRVMKKKSLRIRKQRKKNLRKFLSQNKLKRKKWRNLNLLNQAMEEASKEALVEVRDNHLIHQHHHQNINQSKNKLNLSKKQNLKLKSSNLLNPPKVMAVAKATKALEEDKGKTHQSINQSKSKSNLGNQTMKKLSISLKIQLKRKSYWPKKKKNLLPKKHKSLNQN